MPEGLNRSGDFRNGSPITLSHEFDNPITEPKTFGNPVTLPIDFGNDITFPHEFGNIITPPSPFTFTPSAGTYASTPQVTVSSSAPGTIYYTEDGSIPTTSSPVYGALRDSFVSSPSASTTTGGPYVVGFSFQVTHAITVSQLGRKYIAGNTQNHAINLWVSTNTVTPLATATVLAASSSDGNGFKWATLGTPVTLVPGITYAIATDTTSGGDTWYVSYTPGAALDSRFTNITASYSLSGNGIYPASAGIVGNTYDSPAMVFTPALVAQTSETLRVLQGSNYDSATYRIIPSAFNSYGDSITTGLGLSSPSTQNWSAQFAVLEGFSINDQAVAGSRLCDTGQLPTAYPMFIAGNTGNLILYGANDAVNGDTATPTNLPILVAGLRAFAVWMGLPASLTVKSSGLTYSGTWTPATVFGMAGQSSSTTNDTVTGTVAGSSIYVAGAVQGANVNTIGVYVDGVLKLTQDLSDPLTHSAATAWPFCYRVSGLTPGSHTVQVKILGTAGSGTVYVQWMAGNGTSITAPLPYVGIGDTLPQTDSTYTAQITSYNTQQATMATELQSDGLNVQSIDDFTSVTLGTTDFQVGPPANLHPTSVGATAIAEYWHSAYKPI